jgi:hypothetical protein
MGWIGPKERILDALKAHADRDEDGGYLVRGDEGLVSFLGMGEEYVVPASTEICEEGVWKPLIPLLYGGTVVTVIGEHTERVVSDGKTRVRKVRDS